ncbi:glycosyltransferase family 2 protein [Mucilaginibacter arboris]|uniref:Glycosyltransferase n=1 Tax=Mucilaginibacter arboris TaxID=2682090 RepID=A0A7K1SY41_9SPHI|nr:glycosyltransferase family A protein [Mucilaginibacter arboris]MVN22241.1 glycosyltransferase [Mucilaginibacter arboris]
MDTKIIPQVSVIIPNYNHSNYLIKRIESVLNQSYQDFELIILDDCSTDNSREIIEPYKNNKKVSKILFNEKNSSSTFKQWQKGINTANGKYIWIAESDDYADLSFLKEAVKRFTNDPEVGIVYCDSSVVRDKKIETDFYKKYRNSNFKTNRWDFDYLTTGKDEVNNYLIYDCTINNTSAMIFKKNLVDDRLFHNLNLFRYSGDWYFFLYIAQNCKISYISSALNYFRQGTNNFAKGVKSPLNHFRERSVVRYQILKDFPENIDSSKKVFKQLGEEFMFKLFETIKSPSNIGRFYKTCKQLYSFNKKFFFKQLKYSFSK